MGRRSLLNVLDVENELFHAQTELINGEYQVRLNTYRLLANIGVLVQSVVRT